MDPNVASADHHTVQMRDILNVVAEGHQECSQDVSDVTNGIDAAANIVATIAHGQAGNKDVIRGDIEDANKRVVIAFLIFWQMRGTVSFK